MQRRRAWTTASRLIGDGSGGSAPTARVCLDTVRRLREYGHTIHVRSHVTQISAVFGAILETWPSGRLTGCGLLLAPRPIRQVRLSAADLGLKIGVLPRGPHNVITDVEDVQVGHETVTDRENPSVQRGVTTILPQGGNVFQEKVVAACHVINGFGSRLDLCKSKGWASSNRLLRSRTLCHFAGKPTLQGARQVGYTIFLCARAIPAIRLSARRYPNRPSPDEHVPRDELLTATGTLALLALAWCRPSTASARA
jgi:hypothetical protein